MPVLEIVVGVFVVAVFYFIMKIVRTEPYDKGADTYNDGFSKHTNPYNMLSEQTKFKEWNQGWDNAKETAKPNEFNSHPWTNIN